VETFSENSRLQPGTAAVQMNANNVSELVYSKQYGYTSSCQSANNGNIANIVDPLNGNRSQGFCYDSLNRISAFSNGDGSMQVTYTIDPWGNMTQSGTETLQVHYDNHNRITDPGFDYDYAGNMTASNFGLPATYAYDAMDQLINYDNGGATYTYDGAGHRVRKDAGDWTEYVYFDGQPMAEKNSDGSWSDYIFANGQRIARADSYDERIHTHGTSSGTGEYASWHLPLSGSGYVVKSGDRISWRQYQAGGGRGGVLLGFTDNTVANWNTYDQNGEIINSAHPQKHPRLNGPPCLQFFDFDVSKPEFYSGFALRFCSLNRDVSFAEGAKIR
jgi:YD repeat-containing protein